MKRAQEITVLEETEKSLLEQIHTFEFHIEEQYKENLNLHKLSDF